MTWNEHDATIISLQASLMNAQVRLDELAADNDDLNSELEDLEEQLYEKYEQLGDIDRNRTQHLVTAILFTTTLSIQIACLILLILK